MFTFPMSTVGTIIARSEQDAAANGGFRAPYGIDPDQARSGLWLVGDQGVYIIPNGKLPEGGKPLVCYARECDPTKDRGDWYHYKRTYFGGDDGVEFFPKEHLMPLVEKYPDGFLRFDMTEDSIEISVVDR
jgi:hypothetical protein